MQQSRRGVPWRPESPISGRIFGIDTEYGLWVEGADPADLVEESRSLVRACRGPYGEPWDHAQESPRRDLRGFVVDRLRVDAADARYDRRAPHRTLAEERSDRVLPNGARLYNDHGHPEYSTPECRSLRDLAAHDRAGERILQQLARVRSEQSGREVRIYKNNTDYHGASYGCHENYLLPRDVPFEVLLDGMTAFLVTRMLIAGAGKVGWEAPGEPAGNGGFQLSQRADFVETVASVDTLARRPLFNTRDEPHADAARFRRLHVICGDANLNPYATALKVGSTCLVLALLERGWRGAPRLADPVRAVRALSRSAGGSVELETRNGRRVPALEIQRSFCEAARRELEGVDDETGWVLEAWSRLLTDLESDWRRASDRVDWACKYGLLADFIQDGGHSWDEPLARSLDLEYHCLDPDRGLFPALELEGCLADYLAESQVRAAIESPPQDTRASVRGLLAARAPEIVAAWSWRRLTLHPGAGAGTGPSIEFSADGRPSEALLAALAAAGDSAGIRRALEKHFASSCEQEESPRGLSPALAEAKTQVTPEHPVENRR